MTLLNVFFPDSVLNYFLAIAFFLIVAILITRKSKVLGTVYCFFFGPMLFSAIAWWMDANRIDRLHESELVLHAPEIYTTVYEHFDSLDQDKNGQLDETEIYNYVLTDGSINEETMNQVILHLDQIASTKIIRGHRTYLRSIDHNDLEKLKTWALSKWR